MLPVYDPRCLSPGWLGLTLAKPENCSGDRMQTDEQRGVKRQRDVAMKGTFLKASWIKARDWSLNR